MTGVESLQIELGLSPSMVRSLEIQDLVIVKIFHAILRSPTTKYFVILKNLFSCLSPFLLKTTNILENIEDEEFTYKPCHE